MALTLDALAIFDLVGGALLAATGAFVLVHAPRREMRGLFFAFAGADAAATILFRLALTPSLAPDIRIAAEGAYWWFQIIALGALLAFGARFPRPVASPRAGTVLAAFAGAMTLATLAAYVLDRPAFWSVRGSGLDMTFPTGPAGYLYQAAYGAIVAFLLVRMALIVRAAPITTHADQAAFVFGGIALTYAVAPATLLVARLNGATGLWSTLPRGISSAAFMLATLAALGAGAVALVGVRGRARTVMLAAVGAILLFTVAAAFGLASMDTLQTLAVFLGPILLAYAILRYAVFDVDARVRRAVSLGLGGAGVAAVFIATEGLLQGYLQERVIAGFASGIIATVVAGLLAALLMLPIARLAQGIGRRIVPVRAGDSQHARKLEIYRHALEGAREGGISDQESRVLARLRESLGISDSEHESMLGGSPSV